MIFLSFDIYQKCKDCNFIASLSKKTVHFTKRNVEAFFCLEFHELHLFISQKIKRIRNICEKTEYCPVIDNPYEKPANDLQTEECYRAKCFDMLLSKTLILALFVYILINELMREKIISYFY